MKSFLNPSLSYMAFPIGNALSIQGMVSIIGSILGPEKLVIFSTARTLTRMSTQLSQMVKQNIEPELSFALGEGNLNRAKKLHAFVCQTSISVTLLGGIFLIFTGPVIIKIWTANKVQLDYPLFITLIISTIINSVWLASSSVSISINKHASIALTYLLSTGLAIICSYFGLQYFGLFSAGVNLIIIDLLMWVFVSQKTRQILKLSIENYLSNFSNYREFPLVELKCKVLAFLNRN
jgi:O-antigen/teichoic acid export membrane protein